MDVAVALVVLLCGWMLAQLYDSAYWYNRNLVIIANIEREMLEPADQSRIHFYFGSHRQQNKMIMHLRIQRNLGLSIAALVLAYHLHVARVWQGFRLPMNDFKFLTTLPYFALLVAALIVNYTRNDRAEAYETFLDKSPGKEMDGGHVSSPGHGMLRSIGAHLWLAVRVCRCQKRGDPGIAG